MYIVFYAITFTALIPFVILRDLAKSEKLSESAKTKCRRGAWGSLITLIVCFACTIIFSPGGCSGGGNRCCICNKPATETFQGSRYCTEHYKDAIIWSMNKSIEKENK